MPQLNLMDTPVPSRLEFTVRLNPAAADVPLQTRVTVLAEGGIVLASHSTTWPGIEADYIGAAFESCWWTFQTSPDGRDVLQALSAVKHTAQTERRARERQRRLHGV